MKDNKDIPWFCSFIPHKISNRTVIRVYNLLRFLQKLSLRKYTDNWEKNREAFLHHAGTIEKHGGYIEDQNAYTDMFFGKTTIQYSGCEIIATYNALYNINGKHEKSFPQMIADYEKDGMTLSGMFGTAPKAIFDYLKKEGYDVEMTVKEEEFEELANMHQSLILTMYNDRDDIRREVHTVNISVEEFGYMAHNVYGNGKVLGPFSGINEAITFFHNGKVKGISLIGVSKK